MKIVITGPESTGKTTLAQQLAQYYKTLWCPEYARQYIDELQRPYEQKDLLQIAKGQIALEEQLVLQKPSLLICDTDLITIKIWSIFKYQTCPRWIIQQINQRHYDLYLLCGIDIPWAYDPQREHPHLREELYAIYRQTLADLEKPFIELSGNPQARLAQAIAAIE